MAEQDGGQPLNIERQEDPEDRNNASSASDSSPRRWCRQGLLAVSAIASVAAIAHWATLRGLAPWTEQLRGSEAFERRRPARAAEGPFELEPEHGEELPHPVPVAESQQKHAWQRPLAASEQNASCSETCGQICEELRSVLEEYRVRPASEAPPGYCLDQSFYSKYVNVMGIPVLSSSNLCDCVLQKAAWIIHGTFSHLKEWPEVVEMMIRNKHRIAIMSVAEVTTDVPEHSDLIPKDYWDSRARGLGGTPDRPCTSGAEESVLCFSEGNSYFGENILLHELVHGITRLGFKFMNWDQSAWWPLDWDDFNGRVYQNAWDTRLWRNTYAIVNKIEYFAEGVQSWFDVNMYLAQCDDNPRFSDGVHNCINTREKLRGYDPLLFEHIHNIFVEDDWSPGTGATCGCAGAEKLVRGFVQLGADGAEKLVRGFVQLGADGGLPEEMCSAMDTQRACVQPANCCGDSAAPGCESRAGDSKPTIFVMVFVLAAVIGFIMV